jgi:hypothetical protein
VRIELDSFHITVAGEVATSSTTIATVGAYVVVVATTVPDRVAGVTSCYLGDVGGTIARVAPAPRRRWKRAAACRGARARAARR